MRELEVGKVIEKYRKLRGLSTDELAEKLDIWNRYPPLWEAGLMLPDAAWLPEIVNILEIPSPDAEIVLKEKAVLNINEEELIIPGLKKEYRFLHLSDAHVIVIDEDERQALIDYEMPRIEDFTEDGITPLERMEAFRKYIKEHKEELDGVLLTGDIIDCPFENSIQYLREFLKDCPVPWMYVLGNHDWLHFDEKTEDVKEARHEQFHEFSGGNSYIHKKKFGELTMIAVDNTICGRYEPWIVEELEKMLEGEENVLILQHEVFYSDTLTKDCRLWWHGGDGTMTGPGDGQSAYNLPALEVFTAEESPVKALFTGHLHFHHKDILKGKLPQYIAADASNGGAILYKIHGGK